MTWPPSPQATSTQTSTPPPLTRKLPPAQARTARARTKLGSLLPPNSLRVRRPLLLKRGLPPFQVPNDAFFAPRQSPSPHPDALTIAATFHDITARVLRESNCLLPLGLSATVNPRGSVSLTVTHKATPAASYAPYFHSLTWALNHSFPVGNNPWCTLALAPRAVQLAIHGLPLHFLPQDEEELYTYIPQVILNDKAT